METNQKIIEKYTVVNGTSYNNGTDEKLINVLERAKNNRTRIKVYFGDTETGKNWNEEHDTIGYVGRTSGQIKCLILVFNARSFGGGILSTDNILKVRTTKGSVLYTHPKFTQTTVEIEPSDKDGYLFNTIVDGQLYGRHTNLKQAENLKRKLI